MANWESLMSLSNSDFILAHKRESRGEFFINLFEKCNLSCSFCWQDHDDNHGMDSIKERAYDVIEVLNRDRDKYRSYDVNIMGGELFFDEVDDALFEDYFQFTMTIQKFAKTMGFDLYFNWVTNFVFTKQNRLKNLLERLYGNNVKTGLTTSYDPRGRFNNQSYNLFLDNLDFFKDDLRSIGIVMTRPNILAIMKGDSRLETLYSKYDLYFDYYSPESNFKSMLPLESELLTFFKYMFSSYPQSQPFRGWLEFRENKMTCRSSQVLLPNGSAGQCQSLLSRELFQHFENNIQEKTNQMMEDSFLKKRDCLTCEYYKKCGFGCFLQSSFKPHQDLSDCLYFLTFKHIDSIQRDYESISV